MDVLDPRSRREFRIASRGMSVREAIAHLHAITGNIVGADVVDSAGSDVDGLRNGAAKILKEILGKMIAG